MPCPEPGLVIVRKIAVYQGAKIKARNHTLPSSAGQCRCDHRALCVTSTALFLWGKQARRGRFTANTHPSTAAPLLRAGSREGMRDLVLHSVCRHRSGTATMKLVELIECNMGVNSYSVYVNCLPSSAPSCTQTRRKV